MYTRCSHCSAVFRVTMKELTTAQGKLRCGECAGVFNAMDSLSTKLPSQSSPAEKNTFDSLNEKPQSNFTASNNHPEQDTLSPHHPPHPVKTQNPSKRLWPSLVALALCAALATQVWFSRDLWFSKLRQPEKVKMLSQKVFSHPSQPDTLIITASIKSLATELQPFPYLETRLLDAQNRTIALRRFRPHEYLEQYQHGVLLDANREISIRLKIKDPPGNKAKRFKFSFL